MKSRISVTLLFLLLLVVFASSPPKTQAVWWVDELGDCSSSFVDTSNGDCNTPYHLGLLTETERNQCLDNKLDVLESCLTPIYVPSMEPDFCDAARLANQDCVTQSQNLDPEDPNIWSFYMECRQKSGIDSCQ